MTDDNEVTPYIYFLEFIISSLIWNFQLVWQSSFPNTN